MAPVFYGCKAKNQANLFARGANTMKRRKFFAAASSLAVLAAALLTGCGDAPQAGSLPAGTLTLRVNPEIQIAYDA